MAIGFPMSVSSMGDDPVLAPGRINMIITVVYISSMTVGPALGAVGQVAGIYAAFGIPLAFLIASAALSKVTKPASA
jgi:lipopolysaccharide export LptBFGC system permease protein LptF